MNGKGNRWLWIGGIGAVATGVCCFTPILVIGLGAVGAGAALAYADAVLFPLLAVFLGMMAYGAWRLWRRGGNAPPGSPGTHRK